MKERKTDRRKKEANGKEKKVKGASSEEVSKMERIDATNKIE